MKFLKNIYFLFLFIVFSFGLFNKANAINVGPTEPFYTTLAIAFTDINNGVITGTITLNIVGNVTESGTFPVLNASGSGSANYSSVLIQPSGGAARTISGSRNGAFITLNGASNVTIDGLNTGGNSLTIENTSNGTGSSISTIRFILGANTNTIKNCTLKGSGKNDAGIAANWPDDVATFSSGTILFSTGSNHDITINNCAITLSGANLPFNAICGRANNYNITISNCNISDYHNTSTATQNSFGINVNSPDPGTIGTGGTQSWVIDHTNFFQSASRSSAVEGFRCGAICFTNTAATSFGIDITNNVIGHTSTVGSVDMTYSFTGTDGSFALPYNFIPIYINDLASATTTNIKGNTIAGISFTTSAPKNPVAPQPYTKPPGMFSAISVNSTTITATATPTVNIGGTGANRVDGNVIGLSAYPVTISCSSSITNDLLIYGIWPAFGGSCNIQNNTVSSLRFSKASNGTMNCAGIVLGYAKDISGYCTGNKIYDLDFTSGTANRLEGIRQIRSSATTGWTIANNFISLITAYTVATLTGLHDASQGPLGSINNYFFNSVYLGGAGAGTNSSGLVTQNADASQEQLTVKNNIFYLDRAGCTNNYCINTSIATFPPIAPTTWTSDCNILNNPNSTMICNSGGTGYTLANWKTFTGGDANSFSGIAPIFFNNVSTGDLHITWDMSTVYPGVSLAAAGTYPLGIDIDPQNRANPPDIGADEYSSMLPIELLSFSGTNEGNKVKLVWETVSEVNNDYFIIERSVYGKTFEEIGKIYGAGNSSTIKNYEFIDESPYSPNSTITQSTIYYRLKQTDYDGKYEYYGPISISLSPPDEWNLILQNNLTQDELQCILFLTENENIKIELLDLQGRMIYQEKLRLEKGSNFLKVDLKNISRGAYIIRLFDSSKQIVKKFVRG